MWLITLKSKYPNTVNWDYIFLPPVKWLRLCFWRKHENYIFAHDTNFFMFSPYITVLNFRAASYIKLLHALVFFANKLTLNLSETSCMSLTVINKNWEIRNTYTKSLLNWGGKIKMFKNYFEKWTWMDNAFWSSLPEPEIYVLLEAFLPVKKTTFATNPMTSP